MNFSRQKTISIDEAAPGMVLAYGVYSKDGALLLSGGKRLDSHEQIASLKLASATLITVRVSNDEYQVKRSERRQKAPEQSRELESPNAHPLRRARGLLQETRNELGTMLSPVAKGDLARLSFADVMKLAGRIESLTWMNSLLFAARLPVRWHSEELVYSHSVNVAALCASVARSMGLASERTRQLCAAALLHDVGMIPVMPSFDLMKNHLNDRDVNTLRKHPDISKRIIKHRFPRGV